MKLLVGAFQLYLKEISHYYFSSEFCDIFKNTYFAEHLWMAASGILLLQTKNPDQATTEMFISEYEEKLKIRDTTSQRNEGCLSCMF